MDEPRNCHTAWSKSDRDKYHMISCREPVWGTLPMAKVMRKEALAYTKAGSSLRRPPVPKHLPPKPESAFFTGLCSHLHLWLYGGLSPITSLREGVNLQLQLIKIPGHDKSVSTYKFLWRFSSLPEQVCLATCDCLQPPNLRGMRCFKLSIYRFFWEVTKLLV